jgi:uncharacterized membrane protein YagU involved in acid resistance
MVPSRSAAGRGSVARPTTQDPISSVLIGAGAGIVGGIVFGLMMQMMMPPMMGLIGSLVGAPGLGWLGHLVFSAIIGAGFGATLARLVAGWGTAVGYGLVYGFVWWILGPLLIMPALMGLGPPFGMAFFGDMLMSLVGHLVYGAITGAVFKAAADRM